MKALLIAQRSIKVEKILKYWPNDAPELWLFTKKKKEWFPGMIDMLGERWLSLVSGERKLSSHSDISRESLKKPGFLHGLSYRLTEKISRKYFRFADQAIWSWAASSLFKIRSILDRVKPDIVISFFEPFGASIIAREIAKKGGIPWVVYFRDHCTTYNELLRIPLLWSIQSKMDKFIHSSSSGIVGVSERFTDIIGSYYNIDKKMRFVVTGGYDNSDLPEELNILCEKRRLGIMKIMNKSNHEKNNLKLTYLGTLYEHQMSAAKVLAEALCNLVNEGNGVTFTMRVRNTGSSSFIGMLKNILKPFENAGGILNIGGSRPYSECIRLITESDANIIFEGMKAPHSEAGTITTKIFDSMMTASPTIAICDEKLPIGQYLENACIGRSCASEDKCLNMLQDVVNWKKRDIIPSWYNPKIEYIASFDYRKMSASFVEAMMKVYEQQRGSNAKREDRKRQG